MCIACEDCLVLVSCLRDSECGSHTFRNDYQMRQLDVPPKSLSLTDMPTSKLQQPAAADIRQWCGRAGFGSGQCAVPPIDACLPTTVDMEAS